MEEPVLKVLLRNGVDQIPDVPVPQMTEQLGEAEDSVSNRTQRRTAEQFIDMPVSRIFPGEILRGCVNRSGLSKCPRFQVRKVPRQSNLSFRSTFLRGCVNRSGFLKCPRSQDRKVSRWSKLSFKSEFLRGFVNRAGSSKCPRFQAKIECCSVRWSRLSTSLVSGDGVRALRVGVGTLARDRVRGLCVGEA